MASAGVSSPLGFSFDKAIFDNVHPTNTMLATERIHVCITPSGDNDMPFRATQLPHRKARSTCSASFGASSWSST